MVQWTLVVFLGVLAGCNGQNFEAWCPNIPTDISTCTNLHLSGETTLAYYLASDFNKIFTITGLMTDLLSSFCQSTTKTAMSNYFGCVYAKLVACVPLEWQGGSPTTAQALGRIDFMCQNINDLDIPCMSGAAKMTTLNTCYWNSQVGKTVDKSTAARYVAHQCSIYPDFATCLKTTYADCTKKTPALLDEAAARFQKPAACDGHVSGPSLLLLLVSFIMINLYQRH